LSLSDGAVPRDVKLTIWGEPRLSEVWINIDPASGEFRHEVGMPGPYSLSVTRANRELASFGPFELEVGKERDVGALRIEATGRVNVVLTDPAGERPKNLELILMRSNATRDRLRFEDGVWRSGDLAPGEWTLRQWSPSPWFVAERVLQIGPGEELSVKAGLQPTGSTWVIASVPSGVDARRLEYTVSDPSGTVVYRSEIRGAPDKGYFHIQGSILPVGSWAIEARTDGGLQASMTIDVAPERPDQPWVLQLQ
jgi:hypothetical protein